MANSYSHNVSVFFNNGDGTYAAAVNYGVGEQPHSVCAGDLNGGDDIDLVVANYFSDNVSILMNLTNVCTDVLYIPLVPVNLASNYPNPFNPVTTLKFNVPRTGHFTIAVYDVTGRKVRVLVDRVFQMGAFETTWNGKNTAGESDGSGV
ncbi:MAG: VCBS repeat-containing protein [Candidatus Krumholzibacteriota bacterium]|nr:VCBS repeat-containing protein [Candidatus Krumholzibacteriota bacterium]